MKNHYQFGQVNALIKLGLAPFDSPQDALEHHQRRKEYSMGAGLLGAIGGGALGGRWGHSRSQTMTGIGGALGAAAGYLLGSTAAEQAYDWQHNVIQPATSRYRSTSARLNDAGGFPSGVEPSYAARIARPQY